MLREKKKILQGENWRRKKQIDGIQERYFTPAENLPLIMSNQENDALERKWRARNCPR